MKRSDVLTSPLQNEDQSLMSAEKSHENGDGSVISIEFR